MISMKIDTRGKYEKNNSHAYHIWKWQWSWGGNSLTDFRLPPWQEQWEDANKVKKRNVISWPWVPHKYCIGKTGLDNSTCLGWLPTRKKSTASPTAHLFWKAGLPISNTFCPHLPLLSSPELTGITCGENAQDLGGNEVTASGGPHGFWWAWPVF